MTLSLYERFTGYDWEGFASNTGTFLVLMCLSAGILEFFVGGNVLISISLLLAGLVTAIWEMPQLFILVPQCIALTEMAMTTLKMSIPVTRAVVYLVLAILFLHGATASSVVVGFTFLVSSALNIFAQINFMSDLEDGTANIGVGTGAGADLLGGRGGGSAATPGFGTF